MKEKLYIPKYDILNGASCYAVYKLKAARYAGRRKEAFYAP